VGLTCLCGFVLQQQQQLKRIVVVGGFRVLCVCWLLKRRREQVGGRNVSARDIGRWWVAVAVDWMC
jgi:hypothetical protein